MQSSKLSTKFRVLILTFAVALLLIPTMNFARKPAIEPVMGISIDHMPKVDPKKHKGYPFDSKPVDLTQQKGSEQQQVQVQRPKQIQTQVEYQKPTLETGIEGEDSSVWFLLFLFLLPVAIWFVLMTNIGRKKPEEIDHDVVKPLRPEDKKDEEEHDDDDYQFPKAS